MYDCILDADQVADLYDDEFPDADGDLVENTGDNCTLVANRPGQPSHDGTDMDGYGNYCDGDLDEDFVVGGSDYRFFVSCFGAGSGPCLEADFDGDEVVEGSDFGIFVDPLFGSNPSPSGLTCAEDDPPVEDFCAP